MNLADSVEQESSAKDIIIALSLFGVQEYKEFYLMCIKLVTQLKEESKLL